MQQLPAAIGDLSNCVRTLFEGGESLQPPVPENVLGDRDAQLALHMIYELSYRGYVGVPEEFETDLRIRRLAASLECAMEAQLRAEVNPPICGGVRPALEELATADGAPSLSAWMMKHGTEDHLREFLVHRSAYQLKEADPHSWAIPRTTGATKRALLQIQLDEYGDLEPGASHAELFEATMSAVGLDPTYGAYVECLPAPTLATGNLISLLGMQRRLLGALLGHLALFEMTSVGPMSRYAAAMDRMGFPPSATRFFRVHVEADAEHEVLALNELVGDHVARHPCDEADVIFGACALAHVERAFTETLLDAFESNISALVSAQPDWSLGHSPEEMMVEEASRGCVDSQAS